MATCCSWCNINLSSNRNKMKGQEQHKIEWQIIFLLCACAYFGVQIAYTLFTIFNK